MTDPDTSEQRDSSSQRRSLLRWAGSKRKILPILIQRSPLEFERYVEPFVGSACLFFALQPKKAILGDINRQLMETYDTVRKYPRRVFREVSGMPKNGRFYYELRGQNPMRLARIKRAARFVYLNRFCFNGVFRTNQSGKFNVPMGTDTGAIPPEKRFVECSVSLQSAELRTGDFEKCLVDVQRKDFVYLDPPYATSKREWRGEYGRDSFLMADINRLVKCLKRINAVGALFILSYAESPEIKRAVEKLDWRMTRVRVRRHVAGFRKHRVRVNELLISNF